MSNVNIQGLVENIRGTNVYTPLIELIVNAIQAIDHKGIEDGEINIQVIRSGTQDGLDRSWDVNGFIVDDNGIGFTQENRNSFDELYTTWKKAEGGKGYGRFTCLKYFERVSVSSFYEKDSKLYRRAFNMGFDKDIIVDEHDEPCNDKQPTGSVIEISGIKSVKFPEKSIEAISRVVVERLLPYFIENDKPCPCISIKDQGSTDPAVILNNYIGNAGSQIVEIPVSDQDFSLQSQTEEQHFRVRVFKFYSPGNAKSKVNLIAHRRVVTDTSLHEYVPEFSEEFIENHDNIERFQGRNYIVRTYVFGDYLNDNVSLERGEFRFPSSAPLLGGLAQKDIEQKAAQITSAALGADVTERKERKIQKINQYIVEEAPWHRVLAAETDFSELAMNPSKQEIDAYLHSKKFEKEAATRTQVAAILNAEPTSDQNDKVAQVIQSISETSKNDLIHYVSMRKCALDLLEKSLELNASGKHESEGAVHDIIMRRITDSDEIEYADHNLWILDERLNFSEYISSEKSISGKKGNRTDITIFNKRIAFRGENEASNPITIFEFKKPQRDDFANPSSKDDPVAQIVRYVNQMRDGKFKTPKGRDIQVTETTPFYGYIVCDLPKKVADWLLREKNFTPMPDGRGWFYWYDKINLYIEVLSWEKLLLDAKMRNKIFFYKLGID
jgi:hypothetical protein